MLGFLELGYYFGMKKKNFFLDFQNPGGGIQPEYLPFYGCIAILNVQKLIFPYFIKAISETVVERPGIGDRHVAEKPTSEVRLFFFVTSRNLLIQSGLFT